MSAVVERYLDEFAKISKILLTQRTSEVDALALKKAFIASLRRPNLDSKVPYLCDDLLDFALFKLADDSLRKQNQPDATSGLVMPA